MEGGVAFDVVGGGGGAGGGGGLTGVPDHGRVVSSGPGGGRAIPRYLYRNSSVIRCSP